MNTGLDFLDLEALIGAGIVLEDERDPLEKLGRRIAGQYVDVLVPFVQEVFRGPPGAGALTALDGAQQALTQLVEATNDRVFADHLGQLPELMERANIKSGTRRSGFLRDMRTWVMTLADLLEPDDAQSLRVRFDADAVEDPFLAQLGRIPGVGPRRLQRLFCAGLHSVDVLKIAQPDEITLVTGVPIDVAERCVAVAVEYHQSQKTMLIERISTDARQAREVLVSAGVEPSVAGAVEAALEQLRQALASAHVD